MLIYLPVFTRLTNIKKTTGILILILGTMNENKTRPSLNSQLHEILPHVGIDGFTCSYRRTQLSVYRVNWIAIWKTFNQQSENLFSLLMLFGGHIWPYLASCVGPGRIAL